MGSNERPSVEGAEPPEKLAKPADPLIKALLSSPIHGRPLSSSVSTSRT
jgi:hypothetical protein